VAHTDAPTSPESPGQPGSPTPEGPPPPEPSSTQAASTGDLASYLAKLPRFGPPPKAEPVSLSHAAGEAAFVHQIPTDKRVAFLTIDDGAVRHPMARDLIKAARVPVTLFLTTNFVAGHGDYFQALLDTGYVTIQNHTVSHPNLPEAGYDVAHEQLCTANSRLESWFGTRPIYYRPPYGETDVASQQAAWDCGLRAGFHWRETVDAGNVYYQRDAGHIHPGDIVLMHFRPAFPDDFVAALTAIHDSGLSVARLEDWVQVEGGGPHDDPPKTPPGHALAPYNAPPATEPDRL